MPRAEKRRRVAADENDPLSIPSLKFAQAALEVALDELEAYDESDPSEFPKIIRMCANMTGFTQAIIADKLETTQGTLSRWISDESTPPYYARIGVKQLLVELFSNEYNKVSDELETKLRKTGPSERNKKVKSRR